MEDYRHNQLGVALLRVGLGVVYLAHGLYLKLFVFTLPGTAQFFDSIGLFGPLAYLVFAAETAGGIALLAGYRTRVVALALVPVAQALLGDGAFAMSRRAAGTAATRSVIPA
jgi:putative oxidoreductase